MARRYCNRTLCTAHMCSVCVCICDVSIWTCSRIAVNAVGNGRELSVACCGISGMPFQIVRQVTVMNNDPDQWAHGAPLTHSSCPGLI